VAKVYGLIFGVKCRNVPRKLKRRVDQLTRELKGRKCLEVDASLFADVVERLEEMASIARRARAVASAEAKRKRRDDDDDQQGGTGS
jgi:hypothetical protein